MPIERVLIEYAKVTLQLIRANEIIAELQTELEKLQTKPVDIKSGSGPEVQ